MWSQKRGRQYFAKSSWPGNNFTVRSLLGVLQLKKIEQTFCEIPSNVDYVCSVWPCWETLESLQHAWPKIAASVNEPCHWKLMNYAQGLLFCCSSRCYNNRSLCVVVRFLLDKLQVQRRPLTSWPRTTYWGCSSVFHAEPLLGKLLSMPGVVHLLTLLFIQLQPTCPHPGWLAGWLAGWWPGTGSNVSLTGYG